MFEGITLKSAVLDALRFEIIDYFDSLDARDATAEGLDNAGLKGHLKISGKTGSQRAFGQYGRGATTEFCAFGCGFR